MNVSASFDARDFVRGEERLQTEASSFYPRIELANRQLLAFSRRSIGQLYGAKMAKRFTFESDAQRGEGLIAHVTVSSHDPIVGYYEYGTRPHLIEARRAAALRFTVDGATVFARRVHHPGTKAHHKMQTFRQNFERRALAEWGQAIQAK